MVKEPRLRSFPQCFTETQQHNVIHAVLLIELRRQQSTNYSFTLRVNQFFLKLARFTGFYSALSFIQAGPYVCQTYVDR